LTGTIHGRGDAVALLGPDDDPSKIQHMANIMVKMDQAEIDAIEARAIAEEEGQQQAAEQFARLTLAVVLRCIVPPAYAGETTPRKMPTSDSRPSLRGSSLIAASHLRMTR
jgi:hypothetical protein